jgi:hypothetical protein
VNTEVKSYSADEVTVSFCGQLINRGLTDSGNFVEIEPLEEDFKTKKGADGETARAKTNNRDARVKVKLMQTSLSNNVLSAIRLRGLAAGNGGEGAGVFEVRDRSSGVLVAHSDIAWVEKPPTPGRGKEIGETEWTLYATNCELDPSGNPAITGTG